MNITTKLKTLRDGFFKIISAVDRKNIRPMLSNALVVIEERGLTLIATDLEVSVKIKIPSENSEQGKFCINAKNICDILRELPEETVTLSLNEENNILKISCLQTTYTLPIFNHHEYPEIHFKMENDLELDSHQVQNFVDKTFFAISQDETRPYLNGIFIHKNGDDLKVVATDGHRLAIVDVERPRFSKTFLKEGIILPKKGVLELKKLADAAEGTIIFSLTDSFLNIRQGEDYCLSVRLIARDYPKYQSVVPTRIKDTFVVQKKIIFDAIKRAKLVSSEKSNGIKLSLSENLITITAQHPTAGSITENLSVNYQGSPMVIGFNAKYLMDTLMIFSDEANIEFSFNSELSPVVVKSKDDEKFLGIIMPLKL